MSGRVGFGPPRVNNVELNGELLAASTATAVRLLVAVHGASFNLVNCATAAHRLATLGARDAARPGARAREQSGAGGLPPELCSHAARLIASAPAPGAPSRNLANLLWALAKSETHAPALEAAIVRSARGRVAAEFKPQELSSSAWALARLGALTPPSAPPSADDAFLLELAAALGAALAGASAGTGGGGPGRGRPLASASAPQSIANGAWAFATLASAGRLGGTAGAYAALEAAGYAPAAVAAAAAERAAEFNAQELANTAWALAKLAGVGASGGPPGGRAAAAAAPPAAAASFGSLADAVLCALEARPADFAEQQAANALWGCARLAQVARGAGAAAAGSVGRDERALPRSERLRAALAAAVPLLCRCRPVELAMLAWAYVAAAEGVAYGSERPAEGAAGQAAGEAGEAAEDERERRAAAGGGEEVAEVASFAAALAAATRERARERAPPSGRDGRDGRGAAGGGLSAAHAAQLLWAFARLAGGAAVAPVRPLCAALRRGAKGLSPLDLANWWWALARLGRPPPPNAAKAMRKATRRWLRAALATGATGGGDVVGVGGGLSAQHIATIAWAAARLGAPTADRRLTRLLSRAACGCARASLFNGRDLANTMAALAALWAADAEASGGGQGEEEARAEVTAALADAAVAQLGGFNAQELLKFAGAHARAGGRDERLRAAMAAVRVLRFRFPALPAAPSAGGGGGEEGGGEGAAEEEEEDEDEGGKSGLCIRLRSRAAGRHLKHTGVAAWEGSVALSQWLSAQPSPLASAALRALMAGGVPERGPAGAPAGAGARSASGCGLRWAGSCAVELGAGLGLPSIVAAHRGCSLVVATDGDGPTLELLAHNCARNAPPAPAVLRVAELRWGIADALGACGLRSPPDLLLAADVVYGHAEPVWRALLDSMLQLSAAHTLLLQAQVQRFGREAADGCEPRFRSMLAEYFEAVQVPPDELACSMAADLGRTNCTVHALRRRAVGAHVPRPLALAAADGGSEGGPRVRNGGGAAGDEQHGARAKRPRLARVM